MEEAAWKWATESPISDWRFWTCASAHWEGESNQLEPLKADRYANPSSSRMKSVFFFFSLANRMKNWSRFMELRPSSSSSSITDWEFPGYRQRIVYWLLQHVDCYICYSSTQIYLYYSTVSPHCFFGGRAREQDKRDSCNSFSINMPRSCHALNTPQLSFLRGSWAIHINKG